MEEDMERAAVSALKKQIEKTMTDLAILQTEYGRLTGRAYTKPFYLNVGGETLEPNLTVA